MKVCDRRFLGFAPRIRRGVRGHVWERLAVGLHLAVLLFKELAWFQGVVLLRVGESQSLSGLDVRRELGGRRSGRGRGSGTYACVVRTPLQSDFER